jgi:hypothetical protein
MLCHSHYFRNQVLRPFFIAFVSFTFCTASVAQSKYCVDEIKDLKLPLLPGKIAIYYSAGHEKRAQELKMLLERAAKFYEDSLGIKVDLTLAAVAPKEWVQLLDKPYGLPTMKYWACRRGGGTFPEPRYAAIMPASMDGPLYKIGWQ